MNSLQRTVLVALGLGASYSLSYFGCQYLGTGIWGSFPCCSCSSWRSTAVLPAGRR